MSVLQVFLSLLTIPLNVLFWLYNLPWEVSDWESGISYGGLLISSICLSMIILDNVMVKFTNWWVV